MCELNFIRKMLMFHTIWLAYFLYTVIAIEEPIREKHLPPRHYNPHPYQNGQSKRLGPVVFPYNKDDEKTQNTNDFLGIPRNDLEPEVPYQRIAKKYKKKKFGRYEAQDEKVNPRLEQALAKHGAKVLKLSPEKLAHDHIPFVRDLNKRHNYAFSYKVLDHSSGDDFSHSQSQNSKTTNGEYRVRLPDGRLQIVSYTADQNGYKADVKYETEGNPVGVRKIYQGFFLRLHTITELDSKFHPSRSSEYPVYQIEQIPVRELHPLKTNTKQQQTDYYDEVNPVSHSQPLVKLKTLVPTAIPQRYEAYDYDSGYGNIVVTPSPGYSNGAVSANANFQLPLPLNVQIYTTNARDYSVGSYVPVISSTPQTFHYAENGNYQHHSITPQIIHNGDRGLVVPVSTPSSFVVTDQHGQVIDNIKLVTSTAVPYVVSTSSVPVNYLSTPRPHSVYK